MSQDLIIELQRQNRMLKRLAGVAGVSLVVLCAVAAKSNVERAKFSQIDVERINIVNADGSPAMVLANKELLPEPIVGGKVIPRGTGGRPGIIYYNSVGDETGGLIFDGKLDEKGKPRGGMHFSMDRFGGDQQLALGHYEGNGNMETGLQVFDRGLEKDYGPLAKALKDAPEGPEKQALLQRWKEAGGQQTKRVFVGRTLGKSSAVILADANGQPKIMMLVTPDGKPMLNFMDDKGNVIQSLPEPKEAKQ